MADDAHITTIAVHPDYRRYGIGEHLVIGLIDREQISTRSMDRLAKVARTAADLQDAQQVLPAHVDTAASFVIGGPLRSAFLKS